MIFGFFLQGHRVGGFSERGPGAVFFSTRRCVRQQLQLQCSWPQLLRLGGWSTPAPLSRLPRADRPLRQIEDPVSNTNIVDEETRRRRCYLHAPYSSTEIVEMKMISKYFGTLWLR